VSMLPLVIAAQLLEPMPVVPSPRQLAWHRLEYCAFVHFGPNTFTGNEWGTGGESPGVFNPSRLDCRQWARVFRDAGMRAVIVTAKHHDGFCLWPSKYSSHTVAKSPWRSGKGDVLRELSLACKQYGLKFGVYLSPWDRNHPAYGTAHYNRVFANMLQEVLTQYGPVCEVWFDGANGEGPNGKKQVYDWKLFVDTVRKYQPNACIFSDAGPDVRWVGNEDGHASETNWCTLDKDKFYPGTPNYRELTEGRMGGADWVPAECDVSIRPGWFWRKDEEFKVKSPAQLEEIYFASVGRNANLLLNVPPNRDGLISEPDIAALMGLRKRLDARFAVNLALKARCDARNAVDGRADTFSTGHEFALDLTRPQRIDTIQISEFVRLGQRVQKFVIEAQRGNTWLKLADGTTIGYKRLLRLEPTTVQRIRLKITQSLAQPAIASFELYDSKHQR
jgi:alpha-L-fucosidase